MPSEQNLLYKNNRIQQLRGFCYTMQFGSLSAAAKHMGLTHSTISLQIKSLEKDLSVNLFYRNGPKILPNEDAEKLYPLAIDYITGIDNLPDKFRKIKDKTKETTLRIAANNASLNFILPKLLKKFHDKNPDVFLHIIHTEQEKGLKKLLNNEIDLLLLPRREHVPINTNLFNYTPLWNFKPVLLTTKDHPLAGKKNITIKEISKYEFTLPAKGLHVIPNLHEIFQINNITKRNRITFEDWEVTRKYIEAGLVISITADIVVEENDILKATPLTHIFPNVDYGFISVKGKDLTESAKKLIKLSMITAE